MNKLRSVISDEERKSIEEKFSQYTFFHNFEIFKGFNTPGSLKTDPQDILNRHNIEQTLHGKNTLDIGCMEGSLAYEFEFRGSNSIAVDIHNPNDIAFNLCKSLLDSNVKFHEETVYNLPRIFPKDYFDVIAYRGVYYHLKDPIGALEAIAEVLKPGGKLILSGECLIHQMYTLDGTEKDASIFNESDISDVPITVCYPGTIVGVPSSIWYVPNVACIKSWLQATGFRLDNYILNESANAKVTVAGAKRAFQRFDGIATKNSASIVEHPIWKWRRN